MIMLMPICAYVFSCNDLEDCELSSRSLASDLLSLSRAKGQMPPSIRSTQPAKGTECKLGGNRRNWKVHEQVEGQMAFLGPQSVRTD